MPYRYAALLACLCCAHAGLAGAPLPVLKAERVSYVRNPQGLQIGFWPNYSYSAQVRRDFGQRPIEREGFHKWAQYERQKGVFDFSTAFKNERTVHLAGADIVTNVNCFFTLVLNKDGMPAIPSFYPQDIRDPETRAAARKFLAAFVEAMLNRLGRATLAIDYEMIWFARPIKPEIREAYRDWFVEAAALARETAARLGKTDLLKIAVIVNTDPYDTAWHSIGNPAEPDHKPEKWLLDCVRAADVFCIDTYAGGSQNSTSAQPQLKAVRWWIKNYALDRPVWITESGFSTCREYDPASKGYHIRGTEAQQAAFFEEMFAALENRAQDPLLKRVQAYCLWSYKDMYFPDNPLETYFGLRRLDDSPKPAFETVRAAIRRIEAAQPPARETARADVSQALAWGEGVNLSQNSGTDYQVLDVYVGNAANATAATVRAVFSESAQLALQVRDSGDIVAGKGPTTVQTVRMENLPQGAFWLRLYATGPVFPAKTKLTALNIETQ